MCAVAREVAHQQAMLLEAMAAVADTSIGLGFDADEVAFALHLPRTVAQREVALAQDLLGRLPAVFTALAEGRICLARARVFSDVLIPVTDDGLAREIADRFLPAAEECTASQLRSRLLKAMLAADPEAAQRRLDRSVAERWVYLSANDDTTACLSAVFLPPDRAAAAFERVDAIARGLKRDGESRTLDQLRADVFCDLLAGISPAAGPILRAGAVELLVPLATLTGQGDAPGQLAGYGPVIADIARQIAAAYASRTTETAVGSADLAAIADVSGGAVAPAAPVQWRYRVHDVDGTLLHHGTTRARPEPAHPGHSVRPPEPTSATTPSGPVRGTAKHRSQRTVRSAKPANVRPCPPKQSDEKVRFPGARLRAWIAARDSTCRAPGCTAPARSSDVDHTVDHAEGGMTRHDNLGLLCRHHHRLKHEGGFQLRQPEPGRFQWISPNGRTYEASPDPP